MLKLKEPKPFIGCLKNDEIEQLIDACNTRRDRFLLLTLYETGMRKGELLGSRHGDMGDGNECTIKVERRLNRNGALAKSGSRTIPVSPKLLEFYDDYLIHEYPDVSSDYVFVNIEKGELGHPLHYQAPNQLLRQLEEKTGIKAYPHLFRHTFANRLLKAGVKLEHVSALLGHKSIQTTSDIYGHLADEEAISNVVEHEEKEV